jgi:hypothetical protein
MTEGDINCNDKGKNINCKLQREGRSIVMTREGNQLQ